MEIVTRVVTEIVLFVFGLGGGVPVTEDARSVSDHHGRSG